MRVQDTRTRAAHHGDPGAVLDRGELAAFLEAAAAQAAAPAGEGAEEEEGRSDDLAAQHPPYR